MQPARLRVRIHPGARRDELEGWRNGVLHAGVSGPDPGAAGNAALITLVAERLDVTPAQVTILFGEEDRLKELAVAGLDQASAEARLDAPVRLIGARRGRAAAVAALAVLAVAVLIVVLVSGSGNAPRTASTPASDGGVPVAAAGGRARRSGAAPRGFRTRHHAPVRHGPSADPGRLAQTDARPSAGTREFSSRMDGLWQAIAGGPERAARPAFFPQAAYVQLKSVGDPAGDWRNRLYSDYQLDIAAAHRLLGASARSARLLRIDAVAAYAHWVTPGVCDNRLGYWELPNARLVYSSAGQIHSIGIASLISWRGVWYVVHLGAVTRTGASGVVASPSAGPGTSVPSSTC